MLLEVAEKGTKKNNGHRTNKIAHSKNEKAHKSSKARADKSPWVTHAIDCELPIAGNIANFLSRSQTKGKIMQGIKQTKDPKTANQKAE